MDVFLDLDAFVDDIVLVGSEVAVGAEVEVGSDDVVKPKKRRIKLLKKAEKQVLVGKLKAVAKDCSEAVSTIVKAVDAENHIHIFKDREAFWNKVRLEHVPLSTLFVGLVDLFVSVFKRVRTGIANFKSSGIGSTACCSRIKQMTLPLRKSLHYTNNGQDIVKGMALPERCTILL